MPSVSPNQIIAAPKIAAYIVAPQA